MEISIKTVVILERRIINRKYDESRQCLCVWAPKVKKKCAFESGLKHSQKHIDKLIKTNKIIMKFIMLLSENRADKKDFSIDTTIFQLNLRNLLKFALYHSNKIKYESKSVPNLITSDMNQIQMENHIKCFHLH